MPEYYRQWNNMGPSSHQLYSRHHRLKRRLDHISQTSWFTKQWLQRWCSICIEYYCAMARTKQNQSKICSRSILRVPDSETTCQELRLACSFHYFQPYGAIVAKYSGHLLPVISWYLQEIQELNCSPQPVVQMTCRRENGWPEESCCCQVELLKAHGTMKTCNYKSCKEFSVAYTQL